MAILDWLLAIARQIYPVSLFAALIFSSIDVVLTLFICSRTGTKSEQNPIFRWAMERGGPPGLIVVWLLFWGLALAFYRDSPGIWLVMSALTFFAVVHNAVVLTDCFQQSRRANTIPSRRRGR